MTFSSYLKFMLIMLGITTWSSTAMAMVIPALEGIPAGFETLDAPKQTAVTLYYGGDVLGIFPAHVSPGKLQFDKPEDIVEVIPYLIKKNKVSAALKRKLPTHSDKLCTAKRVDDCGKLNPEDVGIIFDEMHLSAELFINKEYLSLSNTGEDRYLPLPKRQYASVYAFNGAVNGTDNSNPNYALTNEMIHSFGEVKLTSQTTVANPGLRFDTMAASVDRQGWNATGGLFRSRAMQLISDRDIAGVSVSTSRKTVLDQNKTEGNDIILYLPRRAFVSIYREGRLYSSRSYDAGNQLIDTSELPEGAYEITLRIQEADSNVREEKRFFVKTQEIPSAGHPIYYAQAGLARKTAGQDNFAPELTTDPIIRFGAIRRVTDNLALNISTLGVKDRAFIEAGTFWMKNNYRITNALLGSSKGDYGVQAGYILTGTKLSIAVDARKLWASKNTIPTFDDMSQNMTQLSAVASSPLTDDIMLGVRGNYSRQEYMKATSSIGPYMEWRMWQRGDSMLMMNANIARTEGENQSSLFVTFTKRFGKYGMSNIASIDSGRSSNGPSDNVRVWHDNEIADNSIILGGDVTANKNQKIIGADAQWRNTFSQMQGSVQHASTDRGDNFGYGGNFNINAAMLNNELHIGGSQNEKSALIVETKGDAETKMLILVNGTERSSVQVGKNQVIYLSPYHNYNIRLVPEKAGLYDYEAIDKKITLYPGNVTKLNWSVNKFYVVLARIIDTQGQPIANATLQETKNQVVTNEKGYLQAELSLTENLTFIQSDQSQCQVRLPKMAVSKNGVLKYSNKLICRPSAQTVAINQSAVQQ